MADDQGTRTFTVAEDSSVYYGGGYWNDLPEVADFIERRATGKEQTPWFQHLQEVNGGRVFKKALFLNCGNGWVERELLRAGVVKEAVGTDISQDLLDQARRAADDEGLNARYHALDINSGNLPEDGYDLVVNFAAAHHIAYLDKVLRAVAELLPEDGVLVSVDYVGPHRNQYGYEQWQAATTLNASLPAEFRSTMSYPHLPTMLATDPTEAIHSELILETVQRYFRLEELNPVGGGLAYLVLSFNPGVLDATGPERDAVVRQVLDADVAWTEEHGPLFAFFWGRPDKAVLDDVERLNAWTREEQLREEQAAAAGGEYYPLTVLQQLTQSEATLRLHNQHLVADVQRLARGPVVTALRRVLRPVRARLRARLRS